MSSGPKEPTHYHLIGSGGNSRVIIDILYDIDGENLESEKSAISTYDDDLTHADEGYRKSMYGGIIDDLQYSRDRERSNVIVNTIGSPSVRKKIIAAMSYNVRSFFRFHNIIHPSAMISPTAKLGEGNVIYMGAVVNARAVIGDFNLINTHADVEHDCVVGSFNSISPKVTLCGGVTMGNENMLGAGATVIPGTRIGNGNVIAAGATIISTVDDGTMVAGVPGVVKKYLSD